MSWTSVVTEEVVIRSWTFREALKVGPIGFANIGCVIEKKNQGQFQDFWSVQLEDGIAIC